MTNIAPLSTSTLKVRTTRAKAKAEALLRPNINNALTIQQYNHESGRIELAQLVDALRDQVDAVAKSNDLKRAEGILIAQAHTLDAIFNDLAQRATMYVDGDIRVAESYLRLALKAQSQCRATLESLSEIKNPRTLAFVQQANIANGPQQVNNTGAAETSRARNPGNQPNKVLEHQYGKRVDFGTTGATGGVDSTMEAVAAIHRPKNGAG